MIIQLNGDRKNDNTVEASWCISAFNFFDAVIQIKIKESI